MALLRLPRLAQFALLNNHPLALFGAMIELMGGLVRVLATKPPPPPPITIDLSRTIPHRRVISPGLEFKKGRENHAN